MTEKKKRSPYVINVADMSEADVFPAKHLAEGAGKNVRGDSAGSLLVKQTHGTDMSFMLARRLPGYHSTPHTHDSEQFNYVLEGEIWMFIGEDGFKCVKGDIFRVPRNLSHWARVEGPGDCLLLTAHTPPLIGGAKYRAGVHSLLGPGEDAAAVEGVDNEWVKTDEAYFKAMARIEERAMKQNRFQQEEQGK